MKRLSIKDMIAFRRKSEQSKKTFAASLKLDRENSNTEGGGDYWIPSLSAISNSYKRNDLKFIKDKIGDLQGKIEETEYERTKTMYQRNIDILYNYEQFDFKKWRLSKKAVYKKKIRDNSTLTIKGLEIQATPQYVFTSEKDNINEVGAIWFIAKLGGYVEEELGMFADILYRYLRTNFSKEYEINAEYCIAVDVVNKLNVKYSQIQNREVRAILIATIDEIKRYL